MMTIEWRTAFFSSAETVPRPVVGFVGVFVGGLDVFPRPSTGTPSFSASTTEIQTVSCRRVLLTEAEPQRHRPHVAISFGMAGR